MLDRVQYKLVSPTAEEVEEYKAKHHGNQPAVRRVECRFCHKRLWASGMGIGSHNRSRACSAPRNQRYHLSWNGKRYRVCDTRTQDNTFSRRYLFEIVFESGSYDRAFAEWERLEAEAIAEKDAYPAAG